MQKSYKYLDPNFKNRITHVQVFYICIGEKKDKKEMHQKVNHFYLSDSFTKKVIIFFFILLFYSNRYDFITVKSVSLYMYSLSTKSNHQWTNPVWPHPHPEQHRIFQAVTASIHSHIQWPTGQLSHCQQKFTGYLLQGPHLSQGSHEGLKQHVKKIINS